MEPPAEITFWCCVTLVAYAYLGYPCLLLALSLVRRRPVKKTGTPAPQPRVSFIITAHDEEARIGEKLRNTLAQDYAPDALEIIVASDCSTDGTDEIVRRHAPRVRLVRSPERRGKEAAQRLALAAASGDVLVFSDAATSLAADGVSKMVRNFADPTVGCVSSVDRFVDRDGRIGGEGAYVRYEMLLRRLETRVNGLVGLSGSFFAARREVCARWASDRPSDFGTLLNAVVLGLRGVLDEEAAGYYLDIADGRRELQRKVRTVVRGLHALASHARLLDPFRYGLFAWQLASHKLCRWLVPFAMAGALAANLVLAAASNVYRATLAAQCAFYVAALAGLRIRAPLLRIPSFLLLANAAVLVAWARYLRGERIVTWTPSRRLGVAGPAGSH